MVVTIPKSHEISLRGDPLPVALPSDLREASERIARVRNNTSDIRRLLPPGTEIVEQGKDSVIVRRSIPTVPDILTIRSADRMKTNSQYEVLSSMSVATVEDLNSEARKAPAWITDIYLQLPPSLPQRVRDLSSDVTAQANTQFEKAVAIQEY